ncbi:MAG: phosphomannomutase / phosphoglucomutase [Bacillota bacterium]|nr:phosphomannomutase / phosphoglucomutase [Bacillota bacterium]
MRKVIPAENGQERMCEAEVIEERCDRRGAWPPVQVPDHVFREYDIRGVVGRELSTPFVYWLGRALGTFYRRHGVGSVSLGWDARLSSPAFKDEMARGLVGSGVNVVDIGLVPTPGLYFSLFNLDVGGGVMITGSHNPPDENGFKVCLGKTTIYGEAIQDVKRIMLHRDFVVGAGTYRALSVNDAYTRTISEDLGGRGAARRRVKVVVDAGNGTGNIVALDLYRSLGHDVVGLYSEPDGRFPNHHPDPTIPANLQDLIREVDRTGSELGIAFDGDADRIGVVAADGTILWGDQLLILFARDILATRPGAKIIGEVKCSEALFDEIRKAGGVPIMWKVGHSLIKAKLREEGALLAGEMSGHLFFADRYYGFDDAIYAGARLLDLLSRSGRTLGDLVGTLPRMYNTPEIRVDCPEGVKKAVVERVVAVFSRTHEVSCVDGARIRFPRGWGLVRASNTQPVIVLRFEATSPEALEEIRTAVSREVQAALASACAAGEGGTETSGGNDPSGLSALS